MLDMPIKIVKRKKQKTIRVHAKHDHYLVTAPKRMAKRHIDAFIRENERAIKALPRVVNPKDALYPSDYFTLFGVQKPLTIEKGSEDELIDLETHYVFKTRRRTDASIAKGLETLIDRMLKRELRIIHQAYKAQFPKLCDFDVLFKTRYMKSRFGSANPRSKTITVNRVFIHYEKKYLAYIYAHEITHFTHPNHSQSFYRSLERLYPQYKAMRRELRNAHTAYTTMHP